MPLVLASQSPRRRQLMALITPDFSVDEANIDETAPAGPPAEQAVCLAVQKAACVAARRSQDTVIGCDTVVELAGKTLGKPADAAEAAAMLRALSAERHQVHTGVAVFLPGAAQPAVRYVETTDVWFAPLSRQEVDAYVKTDEPYDKAGGYGVQGWAARYVERIEGCYYNVMGLPVASLFGHLRRLGLV